VVLIDWDLEAPGLESFFFGTQEEVDLVQSQPGLIDVLIAYKRQFPSVPFPPKPDEPFSLPGGPPSAAKEEESAGKGLSAEEKEAARKKEQAARRERLERKVRVLEEYLPPLSTNLYPIHPPNPSNYD